MSAERYEVDEEDDAPEVAAGAGPPGPLTARQELALHALLTHPTHKEAAKAAKISEPTLWRYMQGEAFSRRLREARRDAVNHAVVRLQRASGDAVTVLRDLMMKDETPASARITAARNIIDYSLRVFEMDDLRKRVDELEAFVRAKQEDDAIDEALKEGSDE